MRLLIEDGSYSRAATIALIVIQVNTVDVVRDGGYYGVHPREHV